MSELGVSGKMNWESEGFVTSEEAERMLKTAFTTIKRMDGEKTK